MADETPQGIPAPVDGETLADTRLGPLVTVPDKKDDLICGIDRALIEEFLKLIQQNYKRADVAMFFLEQRRNIVNFQAITNVRDVLSHLVTLLDLNTPTERRLAQIHNAEEHLRRAINEPYEIALNELIVEFSELYEKYKQTVLPIKDSFAALANAPEMDEIETAMATVRQLSATGRSSKAKNMWNDEWEEGVISFSEAYDSLFNLELRVEQYYNQAVQILNQREETATIKRLQEEVAGLQGEVTGLRKQVKEEGHKGKVLHIGGYALGFVFFILAAILAVLLFILAEVLKS